MNPTLVMALKYSLHMHQSCKPFDQDPSMKKEDVCRDLALTHLHMHRFLFQYDKIRLSFEAQFAFLLEEISVAQEKDKARRGNKFSMI